MNISINNNINVEITLLPKKNKTDNTKYNIYIWFKSYQLGIKQHEYSLSSGITVNTQDFKNGFVIGRNDKAKLINERLAEYVSIGKSLIVELSTKNLKTSKEVIEEVKANAKLRITGKAPRGKRNDFISKLEQLSYKRILDLYIEENNSKGARKRNYLRTEKLLKEFFEGEIPTINLITKDNMQKFKDWFSKTYPQKENSLTTYLGQFAAVFNFAVDKEFIPFAPIPKKFTGSFVDGNKQTLSIKEVKAIMDLDDNELSKTEKVGKYCMLVQCLTGVGYGDMKAFEHDNVIFVENNKKYLIKKERNKTGITFNEILTENALFMVNKLKELTGNEIRPFNLPSIEYSSRLYKKLGKKAGITTNITTYTFRHTYAVTFMDANGRLEDLKENLGHKNIKTTAIYGKISQDRLIAKAENLTANSVIHQLQKNTKLIAV